MNTKNLFPSLFHSAVVAVVASLTTITVYHYYAKHSDHYAESQPVNQRSKWNTNPTLPVTTASLPSGDFMPQPNGPNTVPGSFREVAKQVRPSVVHIKVMTNNAEFNGFKIPGGGEASGSGVIISSDGFIATNNHVIKDSRELTVALTDGRTYKAVVIGADPSTDLALIKIKDDDFKNKTLQAIEIGNSDEAEVGDWVLAVGNPLNLTSTVTAGIVSAKGRNINMLEGEFSIESFIQTDAVVNPGNSGGALVNTAGQLVGINTAIMSNSGRYEGYSFAVPVNLVRKVIADIKDYGEVQRGLMGVNILNLKNEQAIKWSLPNTDGVLLERVKSGGAADEAGLHQDDVITEINGQKITDCSQMQEIVAMFRPGDKLSMVYLRDGKEGKTSLILRNSKNTATLDPPRVLEGVTRLNDLSDDQILAGIGIKLRELSTEETERVKQKGVLITDVIADSKADKVKMLSDLIVTKINNQKIENKSQALQAIRSRNGVITIEGFYEKFSDKGNYTYELTF